MDPTSKTRYRQPQSLKLLEKIGKLRIKNLLPRREETVRRTEMGHRLNTIILFLV